MIKIQNLRKSFQRPGEAALNVLDDLDFSVDEGEFVAIVGTSGSGKTTLMNILGLLDRPDSGDYELHGKQVAKLSPEQRAKVRNEAIGFVFQQFHLLPKTTATENVELPMLYSSRSDADIRRRARETLCRVGLEDRLTHYPSELSGGQQQRVAIARAIVNDPAVVLADEPTGNLDQKSSERGWRHEWYTTGTQQLQESRSLQDAQFLYEHWRGGWCGNSDCRQFSRGRGSAENQRANRPDVRAWHDTDRLG